MAIDVWANQKPEEKQRTSQQQQRRSVRGGRVWNHNEVELLLNITLQYKVNTTQVNAV